jgi:hypothetical protein
MECRLVVQCRLDMECRLVAHCRLDMECRLRGITSGDGH